MGKTGIRILAFIILGMWGLLLALALPARAGVPAQQPTVAIATVTSTPSGPTARVNQDQEQINVRSGPGTDYDIVGVLVSGEVVPALGRSAGGLWIQISYPGVEGGVAWVYSPLVTISQGGELPIAEPPPTPRPLVTPTIDPTLAAQFVQEIPPTRLPTFTPPPPLVIPTFTSEEPALSSANFPMGLALMVFGIIGLIAGFFSILRGR